MIAMVFSPLRYFNGNIFIPVCPKEVIPLSGSGKISSPNYPVVWFFLNSYCYGLTKETKEEGLQTRIGSLGGKGQGGILFLSF